MTLESNIGAARPRSVLLLCHFYPGAAGAIIDHIEAFRQFSQNEYFILSNLGNLPDWLELSRFDALVFHYSLIACYDNYISPEGRKRIRDFRGLKVVFVQDDYRWINDTVDALAYMRINVLFPLTNPEIMNEVYSPDKLPNVRKETVLAGYVPNALLKLDVKPFSERTLDVCYRARKLPAWMGSHTLQKWLIAERFSADAKQYGLKVDLSCREEDRIYGNAWVDFVANSRATLGTESGASVCDFTGQIQRNVEAHLQDHPDADFDVLRSLYFRDEDCRIMMNVISPRCFEAAALRTLMILYEGAYSGILKPWRHYIPLKTDHSNMDEVSRVLRSTSEAQKIIDQAYREVACNENYSYAAMVRLVDRVMDEEWSDALTPARNIFTSEEFAWLTKNKPKVEILTGQYEPIDCRIVFVQPISKVGGTVEVSNGNLQLKLDRKTSARQVALRWQHFSPKVESTIRIRGLIDGQMVFVMDIAIDGVFQCIQLPTDSKVVDALELSFGSSIDYQLIYIAFTCLDRVSKLFAVKQRGLSIAVRIWGLLPSGVKRLLRPFVRPIRSSLRNLFTRLGV